MNNPGFPATLRSPWQPGESGNRGSKAYKGLLRFARIKSMDMLKVAVACAEDPTAPWPARVSAALAVLDRAWGKPKESVEFKGDGIGLLRIQFVDERSDGPVIDQEAFQITLAGSNNDDPVSKLVEEDDP